MRSLVQIQVGPQEELGARLDGAGDAAVAKAGGSYPPAMVPIASAIDRARDAIGEAADTAHEEGKELALLDAVALAREHLAIAG